MAGCGWWPRVGLGSYGVVVFNPVIISVHTFIQSRNNFYYFIKPKFTDRIAHALNDEIKLIRLLPVGGL
ncbi:hypothetical protein D3C74_500350 [compost metagenome]